MKPKFTPPKRTRSKAARFDVLLRKLKKEIPAFKECKRCGHCCGPLKLHPLEWVSIRKYLTHHELWGTVTENYHVHQATTGGEQVMGCYLMAMDENRQATCLIYPVRPIVCRMQGVKDNLKCPHASVTPIKMTERMNEYYADLKDKGLVLNDMIENVVGKKGEA